MLLAVNRFDVASVEVSECLSPFVTRFESNNSGTFYLLEHRTCTIQLDRNKRSSLWIPKSNPFKTQSKKGNT
jgi:hypothetical protein